MRSEGWVDASRHSRSLDDVYCIRMREWKCKWTLLDVLARFTTYIGLVCASLPLCDESCGCDVSTIYDISSHRILPACMSMSFDVSNSSLRFLCARRIEKTGKRG
jgi:hypothetical protein